MKKILILLFVLAAFSLNAATYYISTTGSNSNNGSIGSPWLTLAHATANATVSGDIIHVNSGTFNEIAQSYLAVGVSIEGNGSSLSIIRSNISTQYYNTLLLESSVGTNGNQHISDVRFDGNNIAWGAIIIQGRSNVHIYNCDFINFAYSGVTFNGADTYQETPPSTYATGNKFYNNTLSNCSEYEIAFAYGNGGLSVGGQEGMLIYGNTMSQVGRAAGHNGYVIKYYCNGYNKGMKIYNNTITKAPFSNLAGDFDFAIEMWNHRGGVEIYNNTIVGGIDIGGESNVKGIYPFSCKVYGNTIGPVTMQAVEEVGVYIERCAFDVIVDSNYFRNLSSAIAFFPAPEDSVGRITISRNTIDGIGTTSGSWIGYAIRWGTTTGADGATVYDIKILNNTIVGKATNNLAGIMLPFIGDADRITVRNNIIVDFDLASIYCDMSGGSSITTLSVENNLFYQNASNAPIYLNTQPVGKIEQNNLTVNPLFVSSTDYRLQETSPVINTGINVGLPYSGSAPDIGAYEYGTSTPEATPASGKNVKSRGKTVTYFGQTIKY